MKKYIRTKEGRIIDTQKLLNKNNDYNLTDDERVFINCLLDNNYERLGWKRRVVKQADTIEELCDELVIDTPLHRHQMSTNYIFDDMSYNPYEELEMLREQGIEYVLYGAIWTDKGLLYVTKMNEEGELELI